MIIYISGPMTGYEDLNFPAFRRVAELLRSRGYAVISPAELAQPDKSWTACMRVDIAAMMQADALARLPGWRESKGARLESHIAEALGMPVLEIGELETNNFTNNICDCADAILSRDGLCTFCRLPFWGHIPHECPDGQLTGIKLVWRPPGSRCIYCGEVIAPKSAEVTAND